MDRNVVIATVLIAIIMFVWMWQLAPPPPEPGSPGDIAVDSQAVAPTLPDDPGVAERSDASLASATTLDSTIMGAQEGDVRTITVETDLYEARLSTKGATLVGFVLKEYRKFDQLTPVNLIADSTEGAVGLVFTTPANHLVDTRSFVFEASTQEEVVRVGEEPVQLTFVAEVGQGVIRQTYTFTPGEYEVGLEVDQENAGTFATSEGYELVWNGGMPFSENDNEAESQGSGAYASSGGEVESVKLDSDAYAEERLAGTVTWASVKSKYFVAALIPGGATRGVELIGEKLNEESPETVWENYTVRMLLPPAEGEVDQFKLYLGPMEFYRITDYDIGLYDMVDYGWFDWMTRPLAKFIFIPIFTLLSKFIPNYGLVIILFAILIKVVLYPLTKTSYKSMARMRELQPKLEAVKEKYGDNPQKQQEAMMKVYRDTGVNPVGGCLPMLLQYPIIIALWLFLPQSIEIRQQGFLWAHDLSAPDVILNLPFTIPLYGDFVAGFTLLMGISMVFQMKIQMTPTASNAQAKIFTYVFPVMIFVIFNRLAAGLSLYYLTYNVVTAIQQKYINSHIEKLKDEPGKEPKKKTKNGRGSRKDASHTQRVPRRLSNKKP